MSTEQTQQEFLVSAKATLGLDWDSMALHVGIAPRALKTYRMPDTSKDHRTLPSLARAAIERALADHARAARRKKKG